MKRIIGSVFVIIAVVISISSCSLSGGTTVNPGSAILFSQASPNTSVPVDIYVDGINYINRIVYFNTTSYNLIAPGAHTISFVPNGQTSPVLLNITGVTFQSNSSYSVFTFDSISSMKGAVLIDNTTIPDSLEAKIRFVQLSPMDSTVDFAVHAGNTLDTGRIFNDVSTKMSLDSFKAIAPGQYTFDVLLHGTSNVIYSIPAQTISGGKVYTIVLTGFTNQIGQTLGLKSYTVHHN